MDERYRIRTMTRREIDIAVDWAAAEGWNPGLDDADCFHAADANGFLIGLLDDQPVATISVVRYGETFGFLGFYIVAPEFRGRGHGLALWNAGLAYLQGRTIGLDGVVAQQDNYRKSGFTLAHNNLRYQGTGGGSPLSDASIVPLSQRTFDEVARYDSAFFPADRRAFLRCWIDRPQRVALGIQRDGALAGYGVLRPCRSGFKLGPLFADSVELAQRLFAALKAHAPAGAPIFLDVPAANPAAVEVAQQHGMTVAFETARMYTAPVGLPLERIFGITTFELG